MKKLLSILITAVTASLSLQAQGVAFLNINSDPASMALAGTGIARTADAYALENNIAATALGGPRMDVAAGYGRWQPKAAGVNIISAAGFYRVTDKLAFGLQFKDFSYPEYSIISADGRSKGSFSPMEMAVGLGAAYRLADGLSAGLSFRYVSSALADGAKASAFGGDVALKYEKDAFQAGLSVNNIGSAVNYGGENYAQPGIVRVGAAYSVAGLTASAEADYLFAGALMAGLGLEYGIQDIVFLRGGFHYGDKAKAIPSYASLGLGAKFFGVHLDLCFLTASRTLGNSLMVGLGYAF
ncbi:MAG: PorV/PorQ family protein [Bacteroidales bacterium]|nr:PorV/PorQ family protein [Bacteroidales bacterium]